MIRALDDEPVRSERSGTGRRSGGAALRVMAAIRVAIVACLGFVATGAFATEYRLGPQDKLRIKLVEWRPGNGEAIEWEPLTDEYTVSAAGKISMPVLGEFLVLGKSPSTLSEEIGEQMRMRVGLATRPEVSVEVQIYRPFYILGSVDKPGEYAFRPGLTALQAVGVAGGMYRPVDAGLLRLERDRITAQGLWEQGRLDLQRAVVRLARVEAELADRTDYTLPADYVGPLVKAMVADETALAAARTASYREQSRANEDLKTILDEQIKTLDGKIASQNKQIDISRRELQSYNTLTSQGLTIASRQFALERGVADAEGKRLDYEMAALTARQDRRKAEQALADLKFERRNKILTEISEARSALDQANSRVLTQGDLVNEASVIAPQAYLDRDQVRRQPQPVFLLVRVKADGGTSTSLVDEATALEPGDVVRVDLPTAPPGGQLRTGIARGTTGNLAQQEVPVR